MKNIVCPNEGAKVKEIAFQTESGAYIEGCQCHVCGGVFFQDWFSLFNPQTETKYTGPNLKKFQRVVITVASVRQCPECRVLMKPLKDDMLPRNLQIERCEVCGGLWLNYGKEKVLRKGMRAISWNTPRPVEFGGLMGDYLLQKLSRFVSTPTVNYFNFLPVTLEDFSNFHGSIPSPGMLTVLDAITRNLFGLKRIQFTRKFDERVVEQLVGKS